MEFKDTLTLDAGGLTITRDGYLVGEARVSRSGNVQEYYGFEIGVEGDGANKKFGVYRDPNVVFDEASMLSLAGRPVTMEHPENTVSAENWHDLAIGQMGGIVRRDGEHVVASMAIMDSKAIKQVQDGARALSAGYLVDIVAEEGIAPDGTPYQFRQAGDLRFNHVAILPSNNPRAGNTRIGDAAASWGVRALDTVSTTKERHPMPDTKSVVWDGLTIASDENGAQIIEKMKSRIETADKAITDAEAKHTQAVAAKDAAIAEKDRALAAKDAEIDSLKGQVLDAAALDAKVAARADLIGKAKAVAPEGKFDGLTDAAIRRTAVVAVLGDAAIADKTEAYVAAYFDILADKAATADPVRTAFVSTTTDAKPNDAWAAMVERNCNAWKKGA